MKLEGSLDIFPLRELIEMTVYSSVTGVINIYNQQYHGQIFFNDGQLYHASHDEKKGLAALALMFEETEATFTFVADTVCEEATLVGDTFDLVDSAERIAARWRRVRRYVSGLDLVPVLDCPVEQARFRISPEHWSIFAAIDGQHTLHDIVQLLNVDAIEVCEAIAQMCDDALINLRQQTRMLAVPSGDSSQDCVASAVGSRPRVSGNFLGRLMANLPVPSETPRSSSLGSTDPPRDIPASPEPVCVSDKDRILHLLRT